MPTPASDKSSNGGFSTPVDVSSSSDFSSDESWAISPERRRKKIENTSISSAPRGNKDHCGKSTATMSNSVSSSSGSGTKAPSQLPQAETSRAGLLRVAECTTPQKAPITPAGTPSSRSTAIEVAFNKLSISTGSQFSTPSRSRKDEQKEKVIFIDSDSSDEDLVPTDEEPVSSPTRLTSRGRSTLTTDSSQSSLNTIFSPISATSSFSSVSSSIGDTSTISPRPVRVQDVFSASGSPNVTPRRVPRIQPQVPQKVTPAPLPFVSPQQTLDAIAKFAHSPICGDLEPFAIAHCDHTQKLLDTHMIAWGTQFELARGVSTGAWTWTDVQMHVRKFQGRTADSAFKVQQVMRGQSTSNESIDMNIWKELDREQAAIIENKSRGLGLMGEWEGVKDWYGGQVQQLARLVKGVNGSYKITLEPMEKRRSHRYARFYGSRRFIQLRTPDELLQKENAQVKRFLTKKFILCGRIFLPFHSKEGSLYMVETEENHGRLPQDWCGDQFRMTYQEFINWHNPLEEPKNHRQAISKYATRFALGLSNSVPALQFEEENIFFIDDITTKDWPKDDKNPPADKLMTDGCGFINHAALHAIVKHMGYESLPAGVQGRIAGGKGFWILHPTDTSLTPKIWIRNSQNKIQYRTYDRAHCIFDLLAPSRPSSSIALTQQSIVNLFCNGIPPQTLVRLMEEGLEEEVAPLLDWDKEHGMVFLWDAINKAGNVSGARAQRVSVSLNRALGLKGRDWGRGEGGTGSDVIGPQVEDNPTTYTGRNKYSGAPLALHEVSIELVQSGFHPAHNKLLNDKIGYIVQKVIDTSVEKYRIPILESLGAFIVPDPLGVLEEGEVYYRFSKPRKDPRTEMLIYTLLGELIVGRYPIRLPSDMQKVTAVDKRELDKWSDVLIISIKDFQSLASKLAGGDMDGDEIIAIWDPEIVAAFINRLLTKEPSNLIEENFEPNAKVETVERFCLGARNQSLRETSEAFMRNLIANLNDSQVGLYSMMHENAVVTHGYDHPESIRLAYIFSTLLDASKTGHRLKHGIKSQDLKKYGKSSDSGENSSSATRGILNILKNAATKKGNQLLDQYKSKVEDKQQFDKKDKDLLLPYEQAAKYAMQAYTEHKITAFTDELSRIRRHVYAAHELFGSTCASYSAKKTRAQESPVKGGRKHAKSNQEDLMVACARAYAQPIENIFLTSNVEQVKASLAYDLSASPAFPFSVAFQELCHIKAMASSGGHAPTLRIFDEAKSFSTSFLRALRACDEES